MNDLMQPGDELKVVAIMLNALPVAAVLLFAVLKLWGKYLKNKEDKLDAQ
jgi:hypothetical protein